MSKIYTSASRIAFLMIVLTVCAGFLWGKLEAKEFVALAGMAFVYYFTKKQDEISSEKS